MPAVQLYYFPLRGRAEVIKLVGAASGLEVQLKDVDYAAMKVDRVAYPCGQCPRLVDGDFSLCQSNAIIRYLAKKTGLMGSTDQEAALVDSVIEGVESLRQKYTTLIYQDNLADAAKEAFFTTHCDPATANGRNGGAHLSYFEEHLKGASSGWMVGSSLSAADLCVYDMVDLLVRIFTQDLFKTYPALGALYTKVGEVPGIKAYLASPLRLEKVNGNGLG